MCSKVLVSVCSSKIELQTLDFLFEKEAGAVYSFVGIIRESNNNKMVKSITYYVLESLFKSLLFKECYSVLEKGGLKVCVVQYCGNLNIGNINLLVGVSAKHRKDAFLLCSELVEFIKHKAPVWKKEFYCDGTHKWINA